jgi:hypothetical protein
VLPIVRLALDVRFLRCEVAAFALVFVMGVRFETTPRLLGEMTPPIILLNPPPVYG